MKSSTLWFSPSRIVWFPSILVSQFERMICVDWLKFKTRLYFNGKRERQLFEAKYWPWKEVFGWIAVVLLFGMCFALWCIAEGLWTS